MKSRRLRGLHIFGIEEGEVVCEIWAEPEEETEALLVEITRDSDVGLQTIADIVQGVGRSLWRVANNPRGLIILEDTSGEVSQKKEPPF